MQAQVEKISTQRYNSERQPFYYTFIPAGFFTDAIFLPQDCPSGTFIIFSLYYYTSITLSQTLCKSMLNTDLLTSSLKQFTSLLF